MAMGDGGLSGSSVAGRSSSLAFTPTLQRQPLLTAIGKITHGFTDRRSGVSVHPYKSLNLAGHVGDSDGSVIENRQGVLRALQGQDVHSLHWVSLEQVHGDDLVQVCASSDSGAQGDGLWTQTPGLALAILVADCVPILLADTQGRAVAAVHAGWRGTAAGIAGKMVKTLVSTGIAVEDLRVALGPAIGPDHFEVGEECVQALRAAYPHSDEAFIQGMGSKWLADLWRLNRDNLLSAGVLPEAIAALEHCTVCEPRYFSYRREGGVTGRQAAVIAIK